MSEAGLQILSETDKLKIKFYKVCWFNHLRIKQFVLIEEEKLPLLVERFLIALNGRRVWVECE